MDKVAVADQHGDGVIVEVGGHIEDAIQIYGFALDIATNSPGVYGELVMRRVNCLLRLNRTREAVGFIEESLARAPDDATREKLRRTRDRVLGAIPGETP